jgi:hypothetical protein
MIEKYEIDAKADELGVHVANVQRDYVFGWLLAGIVQAENCLQRSLTLRRQGQLPVKVPRSFIHFFFAQHERSLRKCQAGHRVVSIGTYIYEFAADEGSQKQETGPGFKGLSLFDSYALNCSVRGFLISTRQRLIAKQN